MNAEQLKDESSLKDQLQQIGAAIGYGRSIQLLGHLWDDMLQSAYGIASRHQEKMFRRSDIERTEAGLPIGRKVVYFQKRGRKGEITAWMPFDSNIPNVARVVSDTPLFATTQAPNTQAAQDVLAERRRQVEQEGWTPAHDDAYANNELRRAASAYAMHFDPFLIPHIWPWAADWWKPTTERRNLVKAGALILAEIERLDRAAMSSEGGANG